MIRAQQSSACLWKSWIMLQYAHTLWNPSDWDIAVGPNLSVIHPPSNHAEGCLDELVLGLFVHNKTQELLRCSSTGGEQMMALALFRQDPEATETV
eukprot:1186771-Amphidinium_carterae.1